MTDAQILAQVSIKSHPSAPYSRMEILQAMSAARADERERVEGEFAEWLDVNNFRRDLIGLWYNAIGGSEDYRKYPTAELYQLFLQSKNNTP